MGPGMGPGTSGAWRTAAQTLRAPGSVAAAAAAMPLVGIAYFLAAWLGLALVAQPAGVAVFWPAAGVAGGAMLALNGRARPWAAAGVLAATFAANRLQGVAPAAASVFALANTGEALLLAWLLERRLGRPVRLDTLRAVIGLLAAAILVAAPVALLGGLGLRLVGHAAGPLWPVWRVWFPADVAGIVAIAPLVLASASGDCWRTSSRTWAEGAALLAVLAAAAIFTLGYPPDAGPWPSIAPGVLLFPPLLAIAVRCPPGFAATASFVLALAAVWHTNQGLGRFADPAYPLLDRVLAAQVFMLVTSLCALGLSALIAERKHAEAGLAAAELRARGRLDELEAIYAAAPVGLAVLSPDLGYLRINERLAEINGLPAAAHLGRTVREIVPDLADEAEALARRIVQSGEAVLDLELAGETPARPGMQRTWLESWTPVRGPDGAVAAFSIVAEEVTGQRRAAKALAESEARFRTFAEASPDVIYIVDAATKRLEYLSPAYERIWGEPRDLILRDLGRWAELLHPEDRAAAVAGQRRLYEGGAPAVTGEYRIRRPCDGAERHIRDTAVAIHDAAGRTVRVAGIAHDLTDAKRAEAALRESEERYRLATRAVTGVVYDCDLAGGRVHRSAGLRGLIGLDPADCPEDAAWWRARIHPDDLARLESLTQELFAGTAEHGAAEYRVRHADGRWVEVVDRAYVVRDAAGRPRRIVGVTSDITARKEAEARRALLLRELSHRVKNMLAVVLAIARQTAQGAASVPDFVEDFAGRLEALAAAHELLTATGWAGASLDGLVRRALDPHAGEGQATIRVGEASVPPALAQDLALVLHELATNAVKYGALSVPQGRVTVEGGVMADEAGRRELRLTWREAGGPRVAPPTRSGFGTTLLHRAIERSRGGRVELDWRGHGLACAIRLPFEPGPVPG